jgi:hypothetical protein
MSFESHPACATSIDEVRLETAPSGAAARAELPRGVLKVLQERGVVTNAVLLLTSGWDHARKLDSAPQLQLTRGTIDEAATLLGRGDFGAVVLTCDSLPLFELETLLASIAARLQQGAVLVLNVCNHNLDREAAHLLLLRSGYDRVWAHWHGRTLCVSAKRAGPRGFAKTCSIVVPVYNEKDTFPELMRRLLDKRLDHLGLEREIILIESNSNDGTREQVAHFASTPGVKILWQDRPRGKGHAVREGLTAATGDIVLIQDADLEYDIDDYDALLQPLLQGRAAFVLGSRHSGRVRMRRFTDQRLLGAVCDVAHLFFTAVINVLYGQNMKDPFTMFKVFRRDCLYALQFECNRFDFDHELLIKLLRKGYQPLEIPVNYCSRSFKQGKKIRFFRDPPGWIKADFKYRLQPLRPRFE